MNFATPLDQFQFPRVHTIALCSFTNAFVAYDFRMIAFAYSTFDRFRRQMVAIFDVVAYRTKLSVWNDAT